MRLTVFILLAVGISNWISNKMAEGWVRPGLGSPGLSSFRGYAYRVSVDQNPRVVAHSEVEKHQLGLSTGFEIIRSNLK
jgi:hypothetical protein